MLAALRGARFAPGPVTLELQRGRKRPRVTGRIVFIPASGAYVLLAGDDSGVPAVQRFDRKAGLREEPADRLHVPVDSIVRVIRRTP